MGLWKQPLCPTLERQVDFQVIVILVCLHNCLQQLSCQALARRMNQVYRQQQADVIYIGLEMRRPCLTREGRSRQVDPQVIVT